VTDIETQVKPYLDEAIHILKREDGVGLAAPQIGIPYAWYVDKLSVPYINPQIIESSDETSVFEGCLSVPERWYSTQRYGKITLRFTNLDGNEEILRFSGLSAWVAQHECDHLSGVLVCDHGERVYKGES
jgi:peptide deformylase